MSKRDELASEWALKIHGFKPHKDTELTFCAGWDACEKEMSEQLKVGRE